MSVEEGAVRASSAVGRWTRRAARITFVAAMLTSLAAIPASAQNPIGMSKSPIPEDPSWKGHVLGDGAPVVSPVRVASTSGAVANARGLIDPSKGPATLTFTPGELPPTIVLDYGREVGGLPYFDVSGVAPAGDATSVNLRAGYSETYGFMWTYGNTTLSIAAAPGDSNIKVGSVGY